MKHGKIIAATDQSRDGPKPSKMKTGRSQVFQPMYLTGLEDLIYHLAKCTDPCRPPELVFLGGLC